MIFRRKKVEKETEVSNEIELILPVLLKSYSILMDKPLTDQIRRNIIDIKYNFSKNTIYSLLNDFAHDPNSSRWKYERVSNYGIRRYELIDLDKDMHFSIANYNTNTPDDFYNTKYIKVYVNGDDDLLNDTERLYIFMVMDSLNEIEKNLDKLQKEQDRRKNLQLLKGIYKC